MKVTATLLSIILFAFIPAVGSALFEAGYGANFGNMGFDADGTISADSSDNPPWDFIGAYAAAWGPTQDHHDGPYDDTVPSVQFAYISRGYWDDEGYAQYCVFAQTAKHHYIMGYAVTGWGAGGGANCLNFDP